MDREQTEIDALAALRPDVLNQIARDAITPFYDPTLARRVNRPKPTGSPKPIPALPGVPTFRPRSPGFAQSDVTSTPSMSNGTTHAGKPSNAYRTCNRQTLICQRPEITGTPPAPLFSTADDFITATRKLRTRELE